MDDRWGSGPDRAADALDHLVYLSNRVGEDVDLVQPGGGNSSVKLDDPSGPVLAVKGSGTDLRSIGRDGFTRLSLSRLAPLATAGEMTDERMMEFMGECMLRPHRDPLPSVETPLHSILPARFILHTHDVVTMSLTNIDDADARALIADLFGRTLSYVPYVRPGFPLAAAVAEMASDLPADGEGLFLAHHGLVVWDDTAEGCYRRLRAVIERAEEALAERRRGKRMGVAAGGSGGGVPAETRRRLGTLLMPVIRGELGRDERVILHHDPSDETAAALAVEGFAELSRRGVSTPEHILRAGRRPIWLDLDAAASDEALMDATRRQIRTAREEYDGYHARHAAAGEPPLPDWAKVVLSPALGLVTAFKDPKSARTAATCYRAVMKSICNAEALGGFSFLDDADVYEFEHWPLERRKVEESARKERATRLLPRHVALIVGGAGGIGEACARRFAEEGACVVVADLDGEAARRLAAEISGKAAGRARGTTLDVLDEANIRAAVETCVEEFGGLDTLLYSAGRAPRFAPLLELTREDLQTQMDVHYTGALLTLREAARVMIRQDLGGSILCSVSKAALAPGKDAAAYGGSKAALQHALRIAALELGAARIRVNALNADQVDTPLFRSFVAARAKKAGNSVDDQLERYRRRNALGVSLIPPQAVADLAAFLASPRAAWTTGDILTVDGGLPDAFPR